MAWKKEYDLSRNRIERNCENCGKSFKATKYQVEHGQGRYCSHFCGSKGIGWKGGRTIDKDGYIRIWQGRSGPGEYLLEHRLVAEKKLGRPLGRSEVVHHINHNKQDNRPENLEILTRTQHNLTHAAENALKWARNFSCCRNCHSTKREHGAKGLCTLCYQALRKGRISL